MNHPETVKEYLREVWDTRAHCNALQRHCTYLREKMQRSMNCTRIVNGGCRDYSIQEQRLLELTDANEDMRRSMVELQALHKQAEDLIARLPRRNQREILQDRYLCHQSWDRIAQTHFLSLRYVQRLHGMALAALQKDYEEIILKKEETA